MKNIILSVFLSSFLISVKGNEAPQLYAHFIKESLLDYTEDIREIWRGTEMNQPPGGYLYRFYFDVTGDGVDEFFLSSSLDSDRRSASWNVFKKDEQNNFKQIAKKISFHPKAFYFKQTPSSGVITEVTGRPVDGGFNIYKYNFAPSGEFSTSSTFKEIKDAEIADFNYEEWLQSLNLGQLITNRNIEKILLGEYVKNPNASWISFNPRYTLDYQYLDPADTNAIKQVENFTPQEAQRLIEKAESKNENQTLNEPTTPTTSISQNNQNNQTSKITAFNNWPLIGWIGLGAVVVGLITYLLLKK